MASRRKDNGITKICKRCGEEKTLDNFFHIIKGNLYSPRCKPCHNAFCAEYRRTEKHKETYKKWSKTKRGKEVIKNRIINWRIKNKLKRNAQTTVSNAIRDKRLFRKPCIICNSLKVEAHHPDYSRPFQITWLCKPHHLSIHYPFYHRPSCSKE